MIYRYEIRNNGYEDILYLYLNMRNEFSKELANTSDLEDLTRRTNNFINNNKIKFNGRKVYLIVDGIIVRSVDISRANKTIKNNLDYSNKNYLINLKDDDNYIEMSLEKYLLGILSNNYNDSIEDETLKCISILYRTYAYREMNNNKYIDNNNFLDYTDITDYKLKWLDKYEDIYNKLLSIINETDCMFLSYEGELILPFIHICNNGHTISNRNYPYLSSVSSLWDLSCINNREILDFNYNEISDILSTNLTYNSNIEIVDTDFNNQILKVRLGDKIFTGEELKRALSLKSLNFNIILYHKFIRFITFGFGNFLGLSIYGANELAKDGITYSNILAYYFPNTKLNKYIKELP